MTSQTTIDTAPTTETSTAYSHMACSSTASAKEICHETRCGTDGGPPRWPPD
jgi:hypothetical protein